MIKFKHREPFIMAKREKKPVHRVIMTENKLFCEGNCMRPLVSIIVPVYKVEDVLARCVDSLCRQSLQEIEIILVDDASPDRCGEICEEYANRDSRFRVIHHSENRGAAAARNTGIAHASSDYLMFVDSDDWAHEDFCKLPYECALQHGADLVMFGCCRVDKDGLWKQVQRKKKGKSAG